ncbi:MAG: AraC family transcriptional regulator [Streptococcus suis]|uniref:AraC family transcriptional regulator n=1 Tax=Streptococcus parasuis TaxID=1501662 RepID=UPI00296549BE|nr:AraC family transcriptional regulator [Streptococcus parasuis]
MIKEFNATVRYLESVLESEIDEREFLRISGYSVPMFSRLFSILTDMSLSEYVRLRKLTRAAMDIREGQAKIIDIALKYGYESSDSFAFAFKQFHQISPSQVRKGLPFKVLLPLQLSLTIQGGKEMEVRIEKKASFTVAGLIRTAISNEVCPQVWEDLFKNHTYEELAALGSGQSFGVCTLAQADETINYMAAYDVTDREKATKLGLELLDVHEADYAIFTLTGPVPQSIHAGWRYALETFFPEHGYRHSGAPDFEYYFEGDMSSPDYQMELWIPIVKA